MRPTPRYLLISLMCLGLSGCEILYYLGGKGSQPALYTFPKDKRVLVLVDVHDSVDPPPSFANDLGEKLISHLFRNKAADRLVSQEAALAALQQEDPAGYKKLGVADIAKAAEPPTLSWWSTSPNWPFPRPPTGPLLRVMPRFR